MKRVREFSAVLLFASALLIAILVSLPRTAGSTTRWTVCVVTGGGGTSYCAECPSGTNCTPCSGQDCFAAGNGD